ncbi:MAG: hypothetical protein M3297_02560, partial [Thermoproteota archaeon]|nr:hypothetical protein [Thermoproteota archaeon]
TFAYFSIIDNSLLSDIQHFETEPYHSGESHFKNSQYIRIVVGSKEQRRRKHTGDTLDVYVSIPSSPF